MAAASERSLASEHVKVVDRVCFNAAIARRLRKDTFLRDDVTRWAVKYVGRHRDAIGSPFERAELLAALSNVGVDDDVLRDVVATVDDELREWLVRQ